MSQVLVKLVRNGRMPTRGSQHAGAWDLYAAIEAPVCIPAGESRCLPSGICTQMPVNMRAQIESRSGLATRHGIKHMGGLIDSDYRGEWQICLLNTSRTDYTVQPHDRVAQFKLEWVPDVTMLVVDELDDTQRGTSGFGASGR